MSLYDILHQLNPDDSSFADISVSSLSIGNNLVIDGNTDGVFDELTALTKITCNNIQTNSGSPYITSLILGKFQFSNSTITTNDSSSITITPKINVSDIDLTSSANVTANAIPIYGSDKLLKSSTLIYNSASDLYTSTSILNILKTISSTFTINTDPTDSNRLFHIKNSTSSAIQSLYSGLSLQISPSLSLSGGKCVGDIRLVRKSANSCTSNFVFSSYISPTEYKDLLIVDPSLTIINSALEISNSLNVETSMNCKTGTVGVDNTQYGTFTVTNDSSDVWQTNIDLGDANRGISIINYNSSTQANIFTGLSFGISPLISYSSGRCLGDLKFIRRGANLPSGRFLFSSKLDNLSYKDICCIDPFNSTFNSNLSVSGLGIFSLPLTGKHIVNTNPTDSNRILIVQNTTTSTDAGYYAGISFGITPSQTFLNGQCQADIRVVRKTNAVSNAKFVFSTMVDESLYRDIFVIDPTDSVANSNLNVNGAVYAGVSLKLPFLSPRRILLGDDDKFVVSSAIITEDTANHLIIGTNNTARGNVTVNYQSSTIFSANTDPTDINRLLSLVNTSTSTAAGLYSNLSFSITPTQTFANGRCLGDIRLVRRALNLPSSKFIFSSVIDDLSYEDILTIDPVDSVLNSNITINGTTNFTGHSYLNGSLYISGNGNSRSIVLSGDGTATNGLLHFDVQNLATNTSATIRFGRNTNSGTSPFSVLMYLGNNTTTTNHEFYGNNSYVTSLCKNNGSLAVGSTSTPLEVTSSGKLIVNNTTASTSTTTGCATFNGGIGVGGSSFFSGKISFNPNNQTWYMDSAASNWHQWRFGSTSGLTPRIYLQDTSAVTNVQVHGGSFGAFSGVHFVKNIGSPLTNSDIGKLFMYDGSIYQQTEPLQTYINGKLCDEDKSKKIYGVITDPHYVSENGEFYNEVEVLALGEGGLLIHDNSGYINIEAGDFIVSRSDGYGRKLEDEEMNHLSIMKSVIAKSVETYSGPTPYLLAVTMRV